MRYVTIWLQMTAGSYMYIGPQGMYTEQQLRYLMVFVK
jgi:urocanate hydratase